MEKHVSLGLKITCIVCCVIIFTAVKDSRSREGLVCDDLTHATVTSTTANVSISTLNEKPVQQPPPNNITIEREKVTSAEAGKSPISTSNENLTQQPPPNNITSERAEITNEDAGKSPISMIKNTIVGVEKAAGNNWSGSNTSGYLSVALRGRLGNNLYMFSSLLGLARATARTPILAPRFTDFQKIFLIDIPVMTREEEETYEMVPVKYDNPIGPVMHTIRRKGEKIMLKGYLQYTEYFDKIQNELRQLLRFNKDIQDDVTAFFTNLELSGNVTRVGIHLRLVIPNESSWITRGFGPPPLEYYRKAMEHYRSLYSNVVFILASDDVPQALELLELFNDKPFYLTGQTNGAVDMAILAACDHVIVGNGTYSWWVGWLCRGTTAYYKKIPPKGTYANIQSHDQYWPKNSTNNHYVSIDL